MRYYSTQRPVMLGSVIHNRHVIDSLLRKGSRIVTSPEEVEPGETVVIRAHGVGEETYRSLEASP